MYYFCLWGAGFEVSVCIMKAERIRIIMLYGSLVLSLSCVCFSLALSLCFPFCHCVSLYSNILHSFSCFYTFAFLHQPPTQTDSCVQTPSHLVPLVYCAHVSICRALWLIETGAVKRPHTHLWSQCLKTRRLRFDGLVPELASPWWGSALGFPVNEALCGWEG